MGKAKYVLTETVMRVSEVASDTQTFILGVYNTRKLAIGAMDERVSKALAISPVHESNFHCVNSLIIDEDDYKIVLDIIASSLLGKRRVSMDAHTFRVKEIF